MEPNRRLVFIFRLCLYLCFFLSGGSALMYQIIWTRKCMLLLGTTTYAVSAVLSIFFLGLGVGSFIGGRIAERTLNPIRWYAMVELLIGLWAWVIIEMATDWSGFILFLIKSMPENATVFFVLRVIIAVVWFTLPSIGMGMTFPLLSKYDYMRGTSTERHISMLYLTNTFGATIGVILAGFILIPNVGYIYTTGLAVIVNIVAGIIALIISNSPISFIKAETNIIEEEFPNNEIGIDKIDILLLAGVFISGLICLALEVLWTRLLIMVFLGTTYAYTSVLVSVLVGIALGALISSVLIKKIKNKSGILGLGYGITGTGILLTLFFISRLPEWIKQFDLEVTTNFYYGIFGKFFFAFLILILPMIGFGFTFPFALTLIRRLKTNSYSKVGLAYGINTIGGIVGSIVGGFFIIPVMGCEKGIYYLGLLLFAVGIIFALIDKQYRAINVSIIFASFALSYSICPSLLMEKINRFYLPEKHKILFFKEGIEGTVAVSAPEKINPNDERVLWINRVQATTAVERGVRMNRFQGIIPRMFNRDPQQVLFMCFGSGITCGTLGIGGFKEIDAVEISPEVLQASTLFADKNFNVLDMNHLNIHIDDARNFLIRAGKGYDFITTEPMPLALAGVSMFYTREFYQFCLQHLNDGGMVSQWVPFHSSSEKIVQSVVHTFANVFPYCAGLFVNADLFLVGSNQPLLLDPSRLEKILEQNFVLKEAMIQAGFPDIEEIMACFVMNKESLIHFSKEGIFITDTFPWVEFDAPKYIYNRKSVPQNLNRLKQCFSKIENNLTYEGLSKEKREQIIKRQQSHQQDLDGLILYYDGLLVGDEVRQRFINSLGIDKNNKQAQYYLRTIAMAQIEQYIRWDETDKAWAVISEVSPYLENDVIWQEWFQNLNLK
ncbi:MAG TPA: fused MFS/spermidine synthase [Candidatus Hydrogenedens sp.]|nr:fused MFS/spermidine synthase [Candidatus Hydrogenedens sp.]HPP57990.1 fused MFS/spermidine synthase [Candidatus Hydrogenedens sp.]